MRRLRTNEEGATAVIVAVCLLMLFGFGAIAVDAGQLYQERRELQNGADGAALAAAQDCADPTAAAACVATGAAGACLTTPVALESRVDEYANANANDAESGACVAELDLANQFITVETETLSGGDSFLTHWFAWALNKPESTVRARATAAWGAPGGGTTIPLTFSYCEWSDMVPDSDGDGVPDAAALPSSSKTILFHDPDAHDCDGPAGQDAPGGFGWLDTDGTGQCQAEVDAQQEVGGDTGNGTPHSHDPGCDPDFWRGLVGETVLIPIFSSVSGTGSNIVYYIEGFAAFVVEGYKLTGGQYKTTPPPCHASQTCVRGHFTGYVAYGDHVSGGGTGDFGARVVTLTR